MDGLHDTEDRPWTAMETHIKSTIRTESSSTDTGALKHDAGKLRFDLIPASTSKALAEVLTHGAKEYTDENWRNGFNWKRVYGATQRHLNKWFDPTEPDTDEDGPRPSHLNHLKHALCNIAFLIEFERTHPELDDRVKL
jgi:hypothetical protein